MSTHTAPVPAFTSATEVAHFIDGRHVSGGSGRRLHREDDNGRRGEDGCAGGREGRAWRDGRGGS